MPFLRPNNLTCKLFPPTFQKCIQEFRSPYFFNEADCFIVNMEWTPLGRVFHRNGAAKYNVRFPVSSLTDCLKRVTSDAERVDLWLV
jgi:hypothetical protein